MTDEKIAIIAPGTQLCEGDSFSWKITVGNDYQWTEDVARSFLGKSVYLHEPGRPERPARIIEAELTDNDYAVRLTAIPEG